MKKKLGILTAILLCCICLPVRADLITIGITGKISYVDDPQNVFGEQININDTITGTYTYDTSTLDSNPDPAIGDYWNYTTPCGFSVNIGNLVFESNSNDVKLIVEIENNGPTDSYLVRSRNNICSNGALVERIDWELEDYSATAITSDALPTTAPNLADWRDYGLTITGPRGWDYGLTADITSVMLIPEPATLLILIFGTAFLKRR